MINYIEYDISYDFYKEYTDSSIKFKEKLDERINTIKKRIEYYSPVLFDKNNFIKEYFVEIFSWSVLSKKVLNDIFYLIKDECSTIVDPCCGNGFHTYLFENFTTMKTHTFDIQDEINSWNNLIVKNGIEAIEEIENHDKLGLLLSWIDYDDLCIQLMEKYKGNIIISLGNYYEHKNDCKYLKKLEEEYNIIYKALLNMPWGNYERLAIYKRK
tara:strand:- start:206 stop:844 length:639 start_codon:yes stop_codon:yes gene_type:complete